MDRWAYLFVMSIMVIGFVSAFSLTINPVFLLCAAVVLLTTYYLDQDE